jgi:hypothetical protein
VGQHEEGHDEERQVEKGQYEEGHDEDGVRRAGQDTER